MLKKLGKWGLLINLVLLVGIVIDAMYWKDINLWWLWIGGIVVFSFLNIRNGFEEAKRVEKEKVEYERQKEDLRKTFSDLETSYHSVRVPDSVQRKLDDYDQRHLHS